MARRSAVSRLVRAHPVASSFGALTYAGGVYSVSVVLGAGKGDVHAPAAVAIGMLVCILLGAPGEILSAGLFLALGSVMSAIHFPKWVPDPRMDSPAGMILGYGPSLLVGALVNALVYAAIAARFRHRTGSNGGAPVA